MKKNLKRKLFTLIELLVVIAIIAVLAGMLLPALSSARNKAKSVGCVNNLKEIGLAMINYSSEYNEWICPAVMYKNTSSQYWYNRLAPRNPSAWKKILQCPSETEKYSYTHYSVNVSIMGSIALSEPYRRKIHKLSAFKNPAAAKTIVDNNKPNDYGFIYPTDVKYRHGPRPYETQTAEHKYNNANKANVLFLDGHVTPMSNAQLVYPYPDLNNSKASYEPEPGISFHNLPGVDLNQYPLL